MAENSTFAQMIGIAQEGSNFTKDLIKTALYTFIVVALTDLILPDAMQERYAVVSNTILIVHGVAWANYFWRNARADNWRRKQLPKVKMDLVQK